MSDPNAERGELWLERGRPDKAEPELRQALALDPDSGELKADLARCLLQLERNDEALHFAREAVGDEPDWVYPRFILGAVLLAAGDHEGALRVSREALALDPDYPGSYSVLASAFARQKKWDESLEISERALEIDPENEQALNARGFALTQLGRRDEAAEGLQASLRRDPENPETHMYLGWNALQKGDGEEAIVHFRESLRLDPGAEGARGGLVEAMKHRRSLYRPFLAWFLFLSRIPTRTAYILLVGSVLVRAFLWEIAEANPSLGVVIYPLYWGLIAFILMSWIAVPLFNLVLRFSRDGKYALDEHETFVSNCLAGVIALTVVLLLAALAGVPAMLLAAGLTGAWAIPLTRFLHAETWKGRAIHGVSSAGLLLLALGATTQQFRYESWRNGLSPQIVEFSFLEPSQRATRVRAMDASEQGRFLAEWEQFVTELDQHKPQAEQAKSMTSMYTWTWVILTWVP